MPGVVSCLQNIILRVYLCQMISLAVMFNELLELSEVSARNGDCFEDIAGESEVAHALAKELCMLDVFLVVRL